MKELNRQLAIERSLITTYRKRIWSRFVKGVKEYRLVGDGDRIAVCISGGKDSMLLAKCMQELSKYSATKFSLEFIVMDPGYTPANRARIEENLALLGIPAHIYETDIFGAVDSVEYNACYLCARMRRGFLYRYAQELGCNKIALGHHFDDVVETILLGMLYGAQLQSMPPKLWSTSHPGMELIRPLYYVKETDVVNWAEYNDLHFIRCACRFTERAEIDEDASKRKEVKRLIAELCKKYENVDINIFRSAYNVKLNTMIGYDMRGEKHSFLDTYDGDNPLLHGASPRVHDEDFELKPRVDSVSAKTEE